MRFCEHYYHKCILGRKKQKKKEEEVTKYFILLNYYYFSRQLQLCPFDLLKYKNAVVTILKMFLCGK